MCVILTGCSKLSDNEKLLRPPELSSEYQSIYNTLKSSTSLKTLSLQPPTSGSYRSSITIYDNNIDNSKYAIAFYKNEIQQITDKISLRMGILNKTNDKDWQCVWDIPCEGETIDQIIFMEDNNKNNMYMIVGYISEQNVQNKYCIYNLSAKNFKTIYTGEYKLMTLCDINSDGIKELITIGNYDNNNTDSQGHSIVNNISDQKKTTKAIINSISDNHVTLWGDTETNSYVQKYTNINIDEKTFGKTAICIDNQISNNFYTTEILIFENNKLKNITLQDNAESTGRHFASFSYDINNDGEIEIPTTQSFPGYYNFYYDEQPTFQPFITTWHKYKNNKMVKLFDTYIDYVHGFGFILPDNWKNKVSINQIDENEIEFFVFHNSLQNNDEKLFKIKVDYKKDKDNIPPNYFILKSEGSLLYLVSFNEEIQSSNSEFSISLEQLKNNFFIISK